jgi:hypothetical protein
LVAQWVWNLRLELGHQLQPVPLRTTEFAPAIPLQSAQVAASTTSPAPASGKRVASLDKIFLSSPMGPSDVQQGVCCSPRSVVEKLMAACVWSMRPASVVAALVRGREQCQWQGNATVKPRQVSVLLHPLRVGSAPLLWRDWSRRQHRRACMHLLRHQRVDVQRGPPPQAPTAMQPMILSRAQRAHSRPSWEERLTRNARTKGASPPTITLFGVPGAFATFLGLAMG